MKDRDIKRRTTIKAGKIKKHDVIEVRGQRFRCDRVAKRGANVELTKIPNGSKPVRRLSINRRKHVDLVRR
jgi:hypothetical protein